MMRDARINQIGEGANEVLTSFIALVGMARTWHGVQGKFYDTMMKPSRDRMSKAWAAGKSRLGATIRVPDVPVQSDQLRDYARQLGHLIRRFNFAVNRALITYREPDPRHAARPRADCECGDGSLRIDMRLEPSGRRNSVRAPKWRCGRARSLRCQFVFASIVSSDSWFPGGLTNNDDKSVLATADSCLVGPHS